MPSEIANIEAFKGQRPAQAFQQLAPADDSLATGIGQSYAVLHYKGKVWSLRHKGETYQFLRPDGSPLNSIDLIILRAPPNKSKSYYPEYDENASVGERPICSSLNGITPDPDVMQQQAEACAVCPRNVLKLDSRGRRSRECSDYKRLAVLLVPAQLKGIMDEPLLEPVFLRVPAASLNSLAVMGEQMDKQGWHYSTYVTRVAFDVNKAYPQFIFTPVQGLSDEEAAVVLPMREDPQALRITGEEGVQLALSAPKAAPQIAPPPPPPQQETGFINIKEPPAPSVQAHPAQQETIKVPDTQKKQPVAESSKAVDDAISSILAGAGKV